MDEMLDVVDENDKIIGKAFKSECHKKGLKHRGVAIIVENRNHEILIQKRSSNKKEDPNKLCISASGHVAKGEDYLEAAKRELKEELGIAADLKLIGTFSLFNSNPKKSIEDINVKLFLCQCDKKLNFQDKEVDKAKFFSKQEIKKMISENPEKFNQASIDEFKYFFEHFKT